MTFEAAEHPWPGMVCNHCSRLSLVIALGMEVMRQVLDLGVSDARLVPSRLKGMDVFRLVGGESALSSDSDRPWTAPALALGWVNGSCEDTWTLSELIDA
jgi:hypothetical protein